MGDAEGVGGVTGPAFENESVASTPYLDCHICGGRGTTMLGDVRDQSGDAPGSWELLRCPNCELIWLNPRPEPSELGKLYPGAYFTHRQPTPAPGLLRAFRQAKKPLVRCIFTALGYENAMRGRFPKLLGRLLTFLPALRERAAYKIKWAYGPGGGRLLDVGCGSGDYLAQMRDLGWDVVGIEPDPMAVQQARRIHDLDVRCGVPEDGEFPASSFDLVTLIHVVEHVHDPAALLSTCHRWLKPGGRLIVVTPNTGSLGRRWFESNWFAWEVPRHLMLFTPRLLALTAERAGFEVSQLRTCGLLARFVWEQSCRIAHNGSGTNRLNSDLTVKFGGAVFGFLERLALRFGEWGEEIVLIASKIRVESFISQEAKN